MKPDGTLTVDEIMQHVNLLQSWEKQDLAQRMGYCDENGYSIPEEEVADAEDAVEKFGTEDLLDEMADELIIEYLEDRGYKVKQK